MVEQKTKNKKKRILLVLFIIFSIAGLFYYSKHTDKAVFEQYCTEERNMYGREFKKGGMYSCHFGLPASGEYADNTEVGEKIKQYCASIGNTFTYLFGEKVSAICYRSSECTFQYDDRYPGLHIPQCY